MIGGLPRRRERHRGRPLAVRIAVAAGGFAVLIGGVAMLVLPGPGLAAVAVGLAILALEFAWAEQFLRHAGALPALAQRATGSRGLMLTAAVAVACAAAGVAFVEFR